MRVDPLQLNQLLLPSFDHDAEKDASQVKDGKLPRCLVSMLPLVLLSVKWSLTRTRQKSRGKCR
jgi:hypothetical protein